LTTQELPVEITQILRDTHFAYFCTTDRNNQPHITPMFFVFDEESREAFVFTHSGSKKIENIKFNPKVCLTVDVRDPDNPFENRGVMVQGEAVVEAAFHPFGISQDERLARIFRSFYQKYPVIREMQFSAQYAQKESTEVLIKVKARKMVYWKGPHFITVNVNH